MTTPSVTLRSIKNEDTGIDISVPRFKEEEAPLGGVSILYEISVLTRLEVFKTRLHKSGDVVQFTIYKAYREIEELYNKLNKKYPKAGLPPVPKASTAGKYTGDEKVEALDLFMKAVAKNIEICHSSTFTHFIGINSHRLPSFTLPKPESSDCDITNDTVASKKTNNNSEVFPKMKINVVEKIQPVSQTVKNIDLFEEVKLTKESTINTNIQRRSSQGLFDDFEDDSLFSSKPAEKAPAPVQEKNVKESKEKTEIKKPEAPKRKEKKPPVENVDDSQIIIKDRKPGDISLFEDQDFGEKEEPLDEIDKSVNENLDDLLNLEPLPNSPFLSKRLEKSEPEQIDSEPPKPVPLPRKKSLGIVETEQPPKPEVRPRKVFLNKNDTPSQDQNQKPQPPVRPPVPAKPSMPVSSKPAPPPKPKPPPKKPKPTIQKENKTEDLDAANANEPGETENMNTVSGLAEDLKELDILKYIEQEEKSVDAQLNLFD
ncbi:HCLS1-binding protein 3 [Trichonephila inaurata madagascariensis]|uniref:HCLS1-binding protein 3 n=1 Tax=Trichonephila inaurata madagascariensis TaxID=2747483 RepID=A0A8X7BTC7_9ARAC|nr:HCLS1-binding protein 3 [Trichonephila inaurata madagascariensis]